MHFRHPVKLFMSFVTAVIISAAGYVLANRFLIQTPEIPKSTSTLGPQITVIHAPPPVTIAVDNTNLPAWKNAPQLSETAFTAELPAVSVTSPLPPDRVLAERLKTSLPAPEIHAPELVPFEAQPIQRPVISAPPPPDPKLPSLSLSKPELSSGNLSTDFPTPPIPAVTPNASPATDTTPLPVSIPPQVDIAAP